METQATPPRPHELLMLGLSVYVLVALAADVFLDLSPPTRTLLGYMDFGICMVFLAEFFVSLARDRATFLKWGWIDLVASIPMLDAARVGRVARIARILRANIQTPGDALWWAMTTITTVGYGDRYPVTPEGRVVAAMLMTVGVGCFGVFTGLVASWFLAPASDSADELARIRGQLDAVMVVLDNMRAPESALRAVVPGEGFHHTTSDVVHPLKTLTS